MKDGRVAGALTVGRSDDLTVAGRLLSRGTDVSDKRPLIEDLDSDIASLAPE